MTGGAITWHVDCMAGALMTTTPTTEIVLGALRERLEQYRAEEYMPFVDESVISVMPGQVIVGAAKNCPLTGVPVSFRHRAPAGADRSVIVSAVKGPCHG